MTESQKHRDQNMQRSPTQLEIERERLEAIRQIEEEIREFWVSDEDDWRRIIFDELEEGRPIASRVIRQCRLRRSIARLEVWRDEMKRGMR